MAPLVISPGPGPCSPLVTSNSRHLIALTTSTPDRPRLSSTPRLRTSSSQHLPSNTLKPLNSCLTASYYHRQTPCLSPMPCPLRPQLSQTCNAERSHLESPGHHQRQGTARQDALIFKQSPPFHAFVHYCILGFSSFSWQRHFVLPCPFSPLPAVALQPLHNSPP